LNTMQINNGPRNKAQVQPAVLASHGAIITDDQHKSALHRDIARRHKRKHAPVSHVRITRELRKTFGDRYDNHGPAMPDGCDAALDDFLILLNYVAMLGDYRALRSAKARWMPRLNETVFDRMVDQVVRSPLYLTPDALGQRIGLTDAKRTELKIKSIGGIGCNKSQRDDRRKANKIAARKITRAADRNRRPVAASKAKPWQALGMSRSSWYANGKPQLLDAGQNLTPNKLTISAGRQLLSRQCAGASAQAGSAADVVPNPASATVSTVRVERVTKRDSAFAGHSGLHWIEISKNPFQNAHWKPLAKDIWMRAA
jgi:hypothetical protein